jgi:hypothetical protein
MIKSIRHMRASCLAVALLVGAGVASFAQSFPFPRSGDPRFAYAASEKPDGGQAKLDRAVTDYYEAWRAKFLVTITHADVPEIAAGREQAFVNMSAGDPEAKKGERFCSVSEGHGYGMLIAALMAGHPNRPVGAPADREQRDFDALYRFFRAHPSVPDAKEHPELKHLNLMAFQVQGRDLGKLVKARPDDDSDSASDGDMDIAYALLLAERQWGHAGEIKYGDEAKKVIAEIEKYDVNRAAATVKLGDSIAEDDKEFYAVRTSDFMPQHWRAFAKIGDRALWERVLAQSLAIETAAAAKFAPKTGLMPDFLLLPPGAKPAAALYRPPTGCFLEREKGDGNWSYNACRTPWRLATDYLVNGDPAALEQLKKLNAWLQAQATRGGAPHPEELNAGYTLAGAKLPVEEDYDTDKKSKKKKAEPKPAEYEPAGSCFLAPPAVSAMLPGSRDWLNALWTNLTPAPNPADGLYFDCTVKLLCMITISGNWWDPTSAKLP